MPLPKSPRLLLAIAAIATLAVFVGTASTASAPDTPLLNALTHTAWNLGLIAALLLTLCVSAWSRFRLTRKTDKLLAAKASQIAQQDARIKELQHILEQHGQRSDSSSITDALTGCYTRASILDSLHKAFSLSRRHGYPLSCVLYDVDEFRQINEELGHLVGDKVLGAVAGCIRRHIRQDDSLGRYGGDEFLLLLPNTRLRGARVVAEKIGKRIAALDLSTVGFAGNVNVNGGIAEVIDGGALSTEELLCQADAALYQAKAQGRACVVGYAIEPEGSV